jgi:hypothetical protein
VVCVNGRVRATGGEGYPNLHHRPGILPYSHEAVMLTERSYQTEARGADREESLGGERYGDDSPDMRWAALPRGLYSMHIPQI